MKKSIIAAGAASVALAAMPIVGAFAATSNVTENITATVGAGCTITNDQAAHNINIEDLALSSYKEATSANGVAVTCTASDWTMTAVGAGTVGTNNNYLYTSDASAYIASDSSAAVDGSVSNWKFKIAVDGTPTATVDIATAGYNAYTAIPSSEQTIATGSTAGNVTIKPSYIVSVGSSQPNGSYAGAVKYTVATVTAP